tara:strand:- start:255 stop:1070 length:816 start_codon:yes stop_codon:yes gene_type:complete
MKKKIRLDIYLLEKGFFDSRQKAQRIILAGKVKNKNGKILDKPGSQIFIDEEIIILDEPRFVSRGGDKLFEAFLKFPINVRDRICIDAGISTGGFTDCLLQNGAKKVYGFDVGYGQTAWKLRNSDQVKLYERTNIRYVTPSIIFSENDLLPDFVVADLSFISIKLVFKPIIDLLQKDFSEGVFLIKPQFEVGKEFVCKGGIVKDKKKHFYAIESVIKCVKKNNWYVNGLISSPLTGPAGNHEYLVWVSNKTISKIKIDELFIKDLIKNTLH